MVWKTNFEPQDLCEALNETVSAGGSGGLRAPLDVTVSVPDEDDEEEVGFE